MTQPVFPVQYFLYAEDDPDDQQLLQEIIASISTDIRVVACDQGLALMQYLEALQPNDSLPCCIILDMNMPIWDGLRTLAEIKRHPHFRQLPVVMFTTSNYSRDEIRARQLGAEAFLTKPATHADMQKIASHFSLYCNYPDQMQPSIM